MSLRTNTVLTLLCCIAFLLYLFAPFSWFVDVHSIKYSDMCLGDTVQTVDIKRDTLLNTEGAVSNMLIFYEDNFRVETDITRDAKYTYESEFTDVQYQIHWDKPVVKVGTYGVQGNETIYPFWFWPVRAFHPAEERTFNVIDCDLQK